MNEESKPSILLSLPAELWHLIMKVVQNCDYPDGYFSGQHIERRQTLLNAALAHRILQPYAQEELLREIAISSEKQLIALVELLRGSWRLAEYAKRTEVIQLYYLANGAEEGLNELLMTLFKMCCNTKRLYFHHIDMRLSTIGKSSALKSAQQTLTWDCSQLD
jgi:hypothetical protein